MNTSTKPSTAGILLVESLNLSEPKVKSHLDGRDYRLDSTSPERLAEFAENATEYRLIILDQAILLESPELDRLIRFRFGHCEAVIFNDNHSANRPASHHRDLSFMVSDLGHLAATVDLALNHNEMKRELFNLRGQIAMSYGFDNIVGQSDSIQHIKKTLARVAETDITILLCGAEGTGKSLAAHTLHHHSRRRHQSIVTFDCRSIDPSRHLELLFGPADRTSVPGDSHLQSANAGSLFIKEIEHLSTEAQAELGAFLKTMRLTDSSGQSANKLDIRFIISTAENLETQMMRGEFNQDLWHQINVLPLNFPSLRDRKEDIELLIEYFLRRISSESGASYSISSASVETMRNYIWPGEVKELNMTLKRAAAVCRDYEIEPGDLGDIANREPKSPATGESLGAVRGRLAEGQKKLIIKALDDNDWNFTQTAQELGIGRTTLWRKIKKYNLMRESEEAVK